MGTIARHTPELTGVRKIKALSLDSALMPHFGDAITTLSEVWGWEEVGDSVEEIVASCKDSIESWYSQMLVGTVSLWLINPPVGWLLLDGSTHAGTDYPELFALLPAHLISGANFTLPDSIEAFSYGVVDEDDAGEIEGDNNLNLTVGQLPPHTHDYVPPIVGATVGGAGPPLPSSEVGGPIATTATGSGDNIDRRPLRLSLIFAVFAGRT